LQQVLFELESPYAGRPYHVSGNALFNAFAGRVSDAVRGAVHVGHGVFVPSEYGEYPDAHSMPGYAGKLGGSLPEVNRYADLFLYRDAAHRWLLESRPRDAQNTFAVQSHGGRWAFAPESFFGVPEHHRNSKRRVPWLLHCYVHAPGAESVLPVSTDVLDGIQVGGQRNYGFGDVSVADSQVVDLDDVSFDGLCRHDAYSIELLSPFVLQSGVPGADRQSLPSWWGESRSGEVVAGDGLRRRNERLVTSDGVFELATVDHGHVVPYTGRDPIGTARNGITRVGTHSRFGFGEFRVRPAGQDRVPGRGEEV
jgi:hypothetical protein